MHAKADVAIIRLSAKFNLCCCLILLQQYHNSAAIAILLYPLLFDFFSVVLGRETSFVTFQILEVEEL